MCRPIYDTQIPRTVDEARSMQRQAATGAMCSIGLSLVMSLFLLAPVFAQQLDGQTIVVKHVETIISKEKIHSYSLILGNDTDNALWFVLPGSARFDLPKNPSFSNFDRESNRYMSIQPFQGIRLTGEGGAFVQLAYTGFDDFYAFWVPAKGRLENVQFLLMSPRDFADPTELSAFVARDLVVNGRVPLQEWLPYSVASDKSVRINPEKYKFPTRLNWDEEKNTERTDYRSEKVKVVTSKEAKRVVVKIQKPGQLR